MNLETNEEEYIPDDCLAEIAEIEPKLTLQERKYVYWRSVAYSPLEAFRRAGYTGSIWRTVETRPRIREALANLNEKLEPEYRITQKKVIGILMEAVELSRLKEQPKNLIEAAIALANISGVGAASKIQIDQRNVYAIEQREEAKALRHLPRSSLENMVGIQRALPYIECEIVDEVPISLALRK